MTHTTSCFLKIWRFTLQEYNDYNEARPGYDGRYQGHYYPYYGYYPFHMYHPGENLLKMAMPRIETRLTGYLLCFMQKSPQIAGYVFPYLPDVFPSKTFLFHERVCLNSDLWCSALPYSPVLLLPRTVLLSVLIRAPLPARTALRWTRLCRKV